MRPRGEFWKRERPDGTLGKTYWTNLFGRRVSTGLSDLEAARRWKRAKLREGADPRFAAAERATLGDAVREMYAELRRRNRSVATQKRARQKLGHFVRLWGEKCKLAAIDARKVGEYIDVRLSEPAKPPTDERPEPPRVQRITVRDELAFLRQTLKLARRQGLYHQAIEDVMPLLFETGHKPKKTWVRERDFPRLLRALDDHDRRGHLAWIVATGSRLGESLRARRGDEDLTNYRVLIRGTKSELAWTTIAIPNRMRKWLRYALQRAPREPGAVLWRPWDNILRDMRAACLRAGIAPVGPHDLRRSFGKWLRLAGFDLETIAKLLRHTDPKLAREVYADVEGDELATVVENAEALARTYKTRTRTPRSTESPEQ